MVLSTLKGWTIVKEKKKEISQIKRVPIIMRVPIIGGKRTSIIINRIPWEEVHDKYIDYIKFAAGCVYRQFQTESTEDLIQEGLITMYKCWVSYGGKPKEELGSLIKTSIWRKLREVSGKHKLDTIDIPTLQEQGHEPGYEDDWDSPLEEQSKLQQVAKLLVDEPIALAILKELVNPSARTVWEAKMDIERKSMLKSQRYAVLVPTDIRPTKLAIRRALGISKATFDWNFLTVKEAMTVVYRNQGGKKTVNM